MLDGFGEFSKTLESKPVPIIFQATGSQEFNFTGELKRNFLQCDLNDLQGEATVFGQVQRILEKGESVEVFSAVPNTSKLNRKQRRSIDSTKGKAKQQQKDLVEIVKGPAIILSPLAVYK